MNPAGPTNPAPPYVSLNFSAKRHNADNLQTIVNPALWGNPLSAAKKHLWASSRECTQAGGCCFKHFFRIRCWNLYCTNGRAPSEHMRAHSSRSTEEERASVPQPHWRHPPPRFFVWKRSELGASQQQKSAPAQVPFLSESWGLFVGACHQSSDGAADRQGLGLSRSALNSIILLFSLELHIP